jgi:putative molybdopterin biosynthesis protein
MSVKIDYRFVLDSQLAAPDRESHLDNPLFATLRAVREQGSIGRAAEALGVSYRHLWGVLKDQEAIFGQALVTGGQGQATRLSAFGERLLAAEGRMRARFLPAAEALAQKLDQELMLALDPELQLIRVALSHDLLFGGLRDCLRRHARILLDPDFVGSGEALERLNAGDCLLAGIHLPLDDARLGRRGSSIHVGLGRFLRLGEHKLVRVATRAQGLMVAPGNPLELQAVADVARPGVVFVNRPPGTGTRLLFDELLALENVPANDIAGYGVAETTHLAVAAAVASGQANCGFGLRAAAERLGLGFVPLVVEQYFLVCRKPALESAAVRALIEVLASDDFRRLAESTPGYGAAGAGEIVSLRRTLPWYK